MSVRILTTLVLLAALWACQGSAGEGPDSESPADGDLDGEMDGREVEDSPSDGDGELDEQGEKEAAEVEAAEAWDDSLPRLRFDIHGGFFDAPFPIMTRLRDEGDLRLDDFPNPAGTRLIEDYLEAAAASGEFSRNGIVYFPFDAALDEECFTRQEVPQADGPVFFVNVDPLSPDYGRRFPVLVHLTSKTEKYRPGNLLAVLPYPGFVQRENTLYAAVVLRDACKPEAQAPGRSAEVDALLKGRAPEGGEVLLEGFTALRTYLDMEGISPSRLAAATVYRTGDPDKGMLALAMHAGSLPVPETSVNQRIRDYESYCVLEGRTTLPIYQAGERPYSDAGSGKIVFTEGEPVVQWYETVRFSLSIPKKVMPEAGFPLLFYSNGQGGLYTQVVDRGTFAEQDADPENGRGPAYYLALAGIASFDIEAPLVGPRHPAGSFAGVDFFNPFNLDAFRDNIRQAASEFSVLPGAAKSLEIDIAEFCEGVEAPGDKLIFDDDNFFFYGHSTGSSIGALVLGSEPAYRAGMLSGAGGSWIYNVVMKEEPIRMRDLVTFLLGFEEGEVLDEFHPLMLLFQTACEASEAMNFARRWIDRPVAGGAAKQILLIEGLLDGYFPPRMANALAMAARLDLAGPVQDPDTPVELGWVDASTLDLPAGPNRGEISAHLIQFLAEGFDGHYVNFNLSAPKYAYKCWFDSLLKTGSATVPVWVDDGEAACP